MGIDIKQTLRVLETLRVLVENDNRFEMCP